jgi:quercetin dioxygenase-like cupin family protein
MVGNYELVQDFDSPEASIRVFRVWAGGNSVQPHVHQHSTQYYVALEGRVTIERDGVETVLEPYEVLPVHRGVLHGAKATGAEAVVLNISVPPLRADDQVAANPDVFRADLRLPGHDRDVDD